MNRLGRRAGGYTIIEVIIVLTVSSLLFAATVVGFSQQNRRTQFTDSVNNFTQDVQDVLNDVETGVYPSNNGFKCSANASGGSPTITTNSATNVEQGKNTDCIFVGKAIQFAPQGTDSSAVDIYTLIGRRLIGGGTDPVANIKDAKPVGLNNLSDRKTLTSEVQISSVKTKSGTPLAGLAMVSTSGSGSIGTGLNARTSLAAIQGSLNENKSLFFLRIQFFLGGSFGVDPVELAKDGIDICLKEGGVGGRTAIVELAPGESQIIVNTYIDKPCS
ncbi:MAG TPA: type II secretion system protein [Candidatus Saccharimonadales bacterium]|nr:type II secretion system protein [Candidatus Saccharimonadales bacterium]